MLGEDEGEGTGPRWQVEETNREGTKSLCASRGEGYARRLVAWAIGCRTSLDQ